MESFSDILSKCLPCASPRLLQAPSSTSSIFNRNHRVSPEENDTIIVDGRNIPIRTTDSKGRRLSNEILNGEINLHFVNDTAEEEDEDQVIIECPTVSNFPLDSTGSSTNSHSNRRSSSPSIAISPDHDIESFETRKKRSQSIVDTKASYNNNSYLTTIFIETEKRKCLRVIHLSPIEIDDEDEDGNFRKEGDFRTNGNEDDDDDEDDDDSKGQDQVDEGGMKTHFRKKTIVISNDKICKNNSSSSDEEDEYWFSKWARRPRLKKYLEEKRNAENKEAAAAACSVQSETKLPEFHLQGGEQAKTTTVTTTSTNDFLNSKNNRERGSNNSNPTFLDPLSERARFSKNQFNDDDCNLYAKNNVSLTLPLPSAAESIVEENIQNIDNQHENEENEKDLNQPSSTIKANFNLSRNTENGFTNYAFQPDSDQVGNCNNYYEEETTSFTLDNENGNNIHNNLETGTGTTVHNNSKSNFNHEGYELSNQIQAEAIDNTIKDSEETNAQKNMLALAMLDSSAGVISTFNDTFATNNHNHIDYANGDLNVDVDEVDLNLNDIPLTPSLSLTPSVQEKPLLFFIHGISGSSETWKGQIDHFHALGYEIVAMDLLGHGLSGTPSNSKLYHFESLVHDVITVFDHFIQDEQRQAVIIGHGYGSCLATVLTRVRPKNTCILVSISGGGPTPMVSSYWCDSPWFPFPCSLFPRSKKKGRFDNPELENIIPRNVHDNILHGQIWLDGDPAFHRRITVPTLLVYGMRDKVVNLVEVCEMERTIPRAFLELIPTAGHMVMWDEPQKLNRMIRKFIQAQWS